MSNNARTGFTSTYWRIEYHSADGWLNYGVARTPVATQAALTQFRETAPDIQFRAVRVVLTEEEEDW